MTDAKARIGKMGEEAVSEYLVGLGHTILERNWRTGHLEVDIISLARDGIHFVEVKSRVAPVMASPEENVGLRKQQNIAKAASRYTSLHEHEIGDPEIWLDVASVVFDGGNTSINYMPGAYVPIHI